MDRQKMLDAMVDSFLQSCSYSRWEGDGEWHYRGRNEFTKGNIECACEDCGEYMDFLLREFPESEGWDADGWDTAGDIFANYLNGEPVNYQDVKSEHDFLKDGNAAKLDRLTKEVFLKSVFGRQPKQEEAEKAASKPAKRGPK